MISLLRRLLSPAPPGPRVLGRFAHLDEMLDAVERGAAAEGVTVRDVFSPVPVEEAVELVSPGKSPVRFVTLVMAIAGTAGGFALGILTAVIWDMVVGGKPVTHHVPFVVPAFELTILLGAIFTLLALLHFARLPFRRFPGDAFRPEFTRDRFGVLLEADDPAAARELLESAGAERTWDVGGAPLYTLEEEA